MSAPDDTRRRPCAHAGATASSCAVCALSSAEEERIATLLKRAMEPRNPKPPDDLTPMSDEERRAKMRELTKALDEISKATRAGSTGE